MFRLQFIYLFLAAATFVVDPALPMSNTFSGGMITVFLGAGFIELSLFASVAGAGICLFAAAVIGLYAPMILGAALAYVIISVSSAVRSALQS